MNERRLVEGPLTEYFYRKACALGLPLSGTFELTPLCNMNCRMCYVRLSKEEQESLSPLRSAKEWISLGEKAKEAGMLYLLLTGGEPFLHPEFREILMGFHKMGFVITVNSNGTLIDESVISWLKECPPSRINITLYGASNEAYARLCGNPQGYTQTDRAIRLLIEAGITVKINCSITPHNVEELPAIIQYAKDHKLHIQPVAYMFPPIRKNENKVGINERFSPKEAAYYTAYADYLVNGKEDFLERSILDPIPMDDECFEMGEGIRCRAGKCSFWITWDGQMTPCGMFPTKGALNVFKQNFSDVWDKVKSVASEIRLPAKCAGCAIKDSCRTCAAMVVTETGEYDKVPQYRCDMMKSYPQQRRLVENLVKQGCL